MSAPRPETPEMVAEGDPMARFAAWLAEAERSEPNDPNAMALATVDADGMPDLRMVLLKDHGPDGFVFFTNFESAKGVELLGQPRAALLFHWKSLRRQVRVRGPVSVVSPTVAPHALRMIRDGAQPELQIQSTDAENGVVLALGPDPQGIPRELARLTPGAPTSRDGITSRPV